MSWFPEWVEVYCQATGADQRTAAALLANESVILGDWSATVDELGECATRMVAKRRVPKFANEHSDALGNELHHLRTERATGSRPAGGDFDGDCPACGGSGFATIPVRSCVWQGRLVLHSVHKRVVTVAVICDRPSCEAGKRVGNDESRRGENHRKRATLFQCERDASCDLVALMREYDRESARRCRDRDQTEEQRRQAFAATYPRLAAAMKGVR